MPLIASAIVTAGSLPVPDGVVLSAASARATLPATAPYPRTVAGIVSTCLDLDYPVGTVLALLTDGGRHLMARALVEGLAFRITGFRVGTYGYNPMAPAQALSIDSADTELRGGSIFPVLSATPEPIDKYEYANAQAASFLCRVAADEAAKAIGEWGIYATITDSGTPAEIGTQVLFAICHRPMVGKTLLDVLVWRLVVQF